VPAHPAVLFGHHFASIAGAGPIVGPIAAAYFGWGAVVLWVLIGCIFIGAVHDMVALYLSVRHEGRSIASVIETVLGRFGKTLFLVFCWSTLILVCAEFTRQVAVTFVHHPEVASASLLFIALAVVFGVVVNRLKAPVLAATLVFVPVMFGCIWLGTKAPLDFVSRFGMTEEKAQMAWTLVLLAYCFLASTLPVWLLLQPRDYLNSYLLYAMMALGFAGVFVARPEIVLDSFAGWHAADAAGVSQPLFPILFITIACGACSGFHALVASGTTAKQIDNERHIRPAAYGGMLLEGVLAVLALIAVGTFKQADLAPKLASPGPVSLFASGLAGFCTKIGIPQQAGFTFMSLAVSAFLMTSVDTATRLARFTWQELFAPATSGNGGAVKCGCGTPVLCNMYVATALSVGLVALLLLGNPEGARNLWKVFASANQLLAGLTLFTASLWLYKNRRAWWVTLFPMLFMLAVSSCGLYLLCTGSWKSGNAVLGVVTAILLALAGVLVLMSAVTFSRAKR
jgi:carbon starvation protein